jgi:hypothetical protein
MADVRAIHSVGHSLVTWLNHAYELSDWPEEDAKPACKFQLVNGRQLAGQTPTVDKGVLFFLYRVVPNEHTRHTRPGGRQERPPLMLDLHYLVIPWGDDAKEEQHVLAWTMRALESHPVLGPGDIVGAGFRADEAVHIVHADLTTEDLMRIWDAIDPPFRLSVPYVARIVPIELDPERLYPPVVTRKLIFEDFPREGGGA